ncbi:MAG TPA: type II toxin-antitoxin system HicA family toxin [Thermoguttaceae bacterium]|nr:type II toxin-antitoxin system HicA family toxin [Thermoguttaceae bacterium]
MAEMPRISGSEAVKVFEHLGFAVVRQKGSHVVLRRGDRGCVISLLKELAIGTLRGALRQAGITVEEFVSAYRDR